MGSPGRARVVGHAGSGSWDINRMASIEDAVPQAERTEVKTDTSGVSVQRRGNLDSRVRETNSRQTCSRIGIGSQQLYRGFRTAPISNFFFSYMCKPRETSQIYMCKPRETSQIWWTNQLPVLYCSGIQKDETRKQNYGLSYLHMWVFILYFSHHQDRSWKHFKKKIYYTAPVCCWKSWACIDWR